MRIHVVLAVCVSVLVGLGSACTTQQVETDVCSTKILEASRLNAAGLFDASVTCAQLARKEDANLLMMLGQIRAMADMGLLKGANENEEAKAGDLYGKVFFTFGGLGFEEVYRDPAKVELLATRVETANLVLTADYNPGWAYKPSSKTDIYDIMIDNLKRHRIWQMRNMALKIQNDAYYDASRAFAELQRRVRVFEAGTPEYSESERLQGLMTDAAVSIPELPPPVDTMPYDRLNEPEPNDGFRQVASGFNGPEESETWMFGSEAEVRASWLPRALGADDLKRMLAETDFGKEVLIGFSFGKRMNASGAARIDDLRHSERFGSYSISARLGVVPESCGETQAPSYPFVVGAIAAFEGADMGGYSASNFPAACGAIVSGVPAALN